MSATVKEPLPDLEPYQCGGASLYVNPDYTPPLDHDDLCRLPRVTASLPGGQSRQAGRATTWTWHPDWHTGPGLFVRQDAHGGALGPLWGTRFIGAGRMVGELRIAVHAQRSAVPVAPPVAVCIHPGPGPVVRAYYVSELVPDAVDLLAVFDSLEQEAGGDVALRRRLVVRLADAIAAMHDAGILHADLNLRNLLVRGGLDDPEVLIIDFDRARLFDSGSLKQRLSNLHRLNRSVMKWSASRRAVDGMDRLRLLRSYLGRYPDWREDWWRIGRQLEARYLRHYVSRQPD